MQVGSHYRKLLESKFKEEIYRLADKAGLTGFRTKSKAEVIDQLLNLENRDLARIINTPSFWARYHNHIYGLVTVIAALLAIFSYYRPIIIPEPLRPNDVSFEISISGWQINPDLLEKVPQSWHGKASISRMDAFEFDMELVKDVRIQASRGKSKPQAVYKASHVRLPVFTTYRKKLENLDGLTLKVNIPYHVLKAFGENISCSLEVQAPDNWTLSGMTDCEEGLTVDFKKRSDQNTTADPVNVGGVTGNFNGRVR